MLGHDPPLLAIPAAVTAKAAFMLPVATSPNAVVYASGHVTAPLMVRAGLLLNLITVVVLSVSAYPLVGVVF